MPGRVVRLLVRTGGWLGLICAVAAQAAPVGEWLAGGELPHELQFRLQHTRQSRCLPDSTEVAVPLYPGAGVLDLNWGRVKPLCLTRAGWSDLGSMRLLSVDAPRAVAAWYAAELDGYSEYRAVQGRLFIAASIPDFLWERDYYKHPNIAISPAPAQWAAAGYHTMIELNRPAPP